MTFWATLPEGDLLHRLNVDSILRVTENRADATVTIILKDRSRIVAHVDDCGGLLLRLDHINDRTTRQAEADAQDYG